jgi:protein tyrosine/serine phosphatase
MKRVLLKWILAGLLTVAAGALCQAAGRGVPASHSIANFAKVNDHLFRGAQPDAAGLAALKEIGVKTIICLRMTNDLWAPEGAEATNQGLVFINIPLRGASRPKDADVARALFIIENSPGPVFVHCRAGCDRTGTIIACYRIEHDHWTGAAAQKEANHYGMSPLEFGMKRFIADFAKAAEKRRATPRPPPPLGAAPAFGTPR